MKREVFALIGILFVRYIWARHFKNRLYRAFEKFCPYRF